MNDSRIRLCIRYGVPFFAATARGEILARYVPFGVVFKWSKNHMDPAPLQGSDLLWWLHASDEDDDLT